MSNQVSSQVGSLTFTIKEASELAGKSINTIRRAIKNGELLAKLVDGRYQIERDSVLKLYEIEYSGDNHMGAYVGIQDQLVDTLIGQLTAKDRQIEELNKALADALAALKNQQLLTAEIQKRLPPPAEEPDRGPIDVQPAAEKETEVVVEEQQKESTVGLGGRIRGWFRR